MIYKLTFGPFHSYIITFGLLDYAMLLFMVKLHGIPTFLKFVYVYFEGFVFKWKLYFHVCWHFVVKGGHDEYENLKDVFIVDDEE
jgi:hypothetical protein